MDIFPNVPGLFPNRKDYPDVSAPAAVAGRHRELLAKPGPEPAIHWRLANKKSLLNTLNYNKIYANKKVVLVSSINRGRCFTARPNLVFFPDFF